MPGIFNRLVSKVSSAAGDVATGRGQFGAAGGAMRGVFSKKKKLLPNVVGASNGLGGLSKRDVTQSGNQAEIFNTSLKRRKFGREPMRY